MTPAPSGKPIQVLVVDDSAVVRGFVVRCLTADPRLEIAGSCSNGAMAVAQVARKKVDVIVLDIEMPVMDGLEALPKLLQACPGVQVVMASTLTRRNAAITMRALSLGAADYIAKPATDQLRSSEEFGRELLRRVVALGSRAATVAKPRFTAPSKLELRASSSSAPGIVAIGSSTGGPKALLTLLGNLSPAVNCPIVIAQHMPPTFTTVLAQHIAQASGRSCQEAEDGMAIKPGAWRLSPSVGGRTQWHHRATQSGVAGEFLPAVGRSASSQCGKVVRSYQLRNCAHRDGKRWMRRRARNGRQRGHDSCPR